MLRVFLFQILLFLLPFIGYGLYIWVTRGLAQVQDAYQRERIVWLTLAGFGCVLLGLVALAAFGQKDEGDYVPLQYRDGELVPGGFRDED